jgi:hypothetical protein
MRSQRILEALGVGALLVYLAAALCWLPDLGNLVLALVFAIGPVAIMGVLGMHERLRATANPFTLRVATTYLVIAFALLNLMIVVQQMGFRQFERLRSAATDATARAALETVFKGTNTVQLGIDVSFDVFYCLGVWLLSWIMYHDRDFGRLLGAFGMIAAASLLVLNLATFPVGPKDAGLVDLGPVTGVWWLLVFFRMKWTAARAARLAPALPSSGGQ